MAALSPQTLHIAPTDVPEVRLVGPYVFVSCDGRPDGPHLCFLSIDAQEEWMGKVDHDTAQLKAQLRLDLGDDASDAIVYGEPAA